MKSSIENSVYALQIHNYTNLRKNLSTRPNPPNPEDVVEGVIRIVAKTSPKLNYTFGKDALLTSFMKKTMPRALFHKLTGRVLNKIFMKELT